MNKINILFLLNSLSIGGTEKSLYRLIKSLDRTSFNPMVVYLFDRAHDESLIDDFEQLNCILISVGFHTKFSITGYIRLIKALLKLKPHIIHSQQPYANILAKILGRIFTKCFILQKASNAFYGHNNPLTYLTVFFDRLTIFLSDNVVCNSLSVESFYFPKQPPVLYTRESDIRTTKHFTLYNIIESQSERKECDRGLLNKTYCINDNCSLLISVGRLVKQKNHECIIRAISLLSQKDIFLLIIGDGKLKSYLHDRSWRLGIADRVRFVGFQKNLDLFFNCATIFVFPSLWEGFPNALLEALGRGLPCIASSIAPHREIIKDGYNGFLFDPLNAEELSFKMATLLDDANKRTLFSENAKHSMTRFDPQNITALYQNLYHKYSLWIRR